MTLSPDDPDAPAPPAPRDHLGWLGPLRRKRVRVGILLAILACIFMALAFFTSMPGESFKGELPSPADDLASLAQSLQADLEHLAITIGERNVSRHPTQLEESAQWLEHKLRTSGWPNVESHEYEVEEQKVRNLVVEIPGTERPDEILIVGAHYDSVVGSPGANDNGSGVVSLIALTQRFSPTASFVNFTRTVRFVFFVNEEPPWFQHEEMGSLVYANRCRDRKEKIVGMLSLETLGYYSDQKGSQSFPIPILKAFFPDTGNFIAFVGSTKSRKFIQQVVGAFRQHTQFPSEGAAIPQAVPGVGWSDHWSFEIHGYPALMVTDTAPFRYPHYHQESDTPDKLDYDRLARVTLGIEQVVRELLAAD